VRLIYFLGIYDFTGVEMFTVQRVMSLIFCIHNKDVIAVLYEVYVNFCL